MLNARSFRMNVVLIITCCILLFGLVYVFGPMITIATFHFEKENFLISPIMENYHYMYVAFGLLLISFVLLAWRKTKLTMLVGVFGVILFGYFSYLSTQGYFALHADYVVMKTAKEEHKIDWQELTLVEYEETFGGIPKKLYFYSEHEQIEIETTGQFTYDIITKVRKIADKYDVAYEERLNN
jgi:hypothetical protein